jgi:hypothetical protein
MELKFAVKTLTTLYRHSTDLHESNNNSHNEKQPIINPRRIVKQAMRGVRFAATTTTTALGNVASEIAGRWVHPLREKVGILKGFQLRLATKLTPSHGPDSARVREQIKACTPISHTANFVYLDSMDFSLPVASSSPSANQAGITWSFRTFLASSLL